ncbi:MAG: N-acetyltransferase [Chloroflexi bacterium]|nr:GNAT family N-acetyltransferase [Chloroflexota bacterium]MQC18703.1 N-acetyltransferase [Chloroflexota bacterium]
MERPGVGQAVEQDRAFATLMLAFSNDPLLRWMFPDPQQYQTHFPELMRHFAGNAFEAGTAHEAAGYRAVALWLPPGVHSDEQALGEFAAHVIDEARQPALFGLMGQIGAIHPQEPVWYLPVVGVDPVSQGKGLGSALLAHALAECDAQHLPAYLESSNPRNNPLYERHGFEVMEVFQLGDSPQVWPMYRKAR